MLMARYDDIEIRSEEVQEILGTPPGWLVTWGTVIAFGTILVLGWIGYFVEYPDKETAVISVSSTDPPKVLIAEDNSYITKILVSNEDTVESGQTLVVFEDKANFEDVLTLENWIIGVKNLTDSALLAFNPPSDLLLGDLQQFLYDVLEKQEALQLSNSRKLEKQSSSQLKRQIPKARRDIDSYQRQVQNLQKQLALANQQYAREQNLFHENLVTPDRLRQTQEEILALERMIQRLESSSKNKQFEIKLIEKQISGSSRSDQAFRSNASIELKDSFMKLQGAVEDWKKSALVVAPVNGIVLFTNESIVENQFVLGETELMKVIPVDERETKGKISLNLDGSGKVQVGQKVIVKFDSYPFAEFGAVVGEVSWKGKVPIKNRIPIEVRFPEGLTTTTGRKIDPSQDMTGQAEIIMEDKRFIERIFENVRQVFS